MISIFYDDINPTNILLSAHLTFMLFSQMALEQKSWSQRCNEKVTISKKFCPKKEKVIISRRNRLISRSQGYKTFFSSSLKRQGKLERFYFCKPFQPGKIFAGN
jgi:hypothetical protein